MTDTSIRAELRAAADQPNPWDSLSSLATGVALAFVSLVEPWGQVKDDDESASWLLLLVAEAL